MSGFIESAIREWGFWGVALLMFLENIFPPIPSEVVMPLAGIEAAKGGRSLIVLVAGGVAGSTAGAIPWWLAGRMLSRERLKRLARRRGRWIALHPSEIDDAMTWFKKWGWAAVFFGRLVPGVRTLISVPAGAARMAPTPFFALTALGSALWVGALAGFGYVLGSQDETVTQWIGLAANAIIAGAVVLYLYRVLTFRAEDRPDEIG